MRISLWAIIPHSLRSSNRARAAVATIGREQPDAEDSLRRSLREC